MYFKENIKAIVYTFYNEITANTKYYVPDTI